jgi:hypothetical protein
MKLSEYIVLPRLKLILTCFAGTIKIDDLIDHLNLMVRDKDFNAAFNIINDVREASTEIGLKDMGTFLKFIKSNERWHGKRNAAILTKTPRQAAVSHLLSMTSVEFPVNVNFFTTLPETLKWANVPAEQLPSIKNLLDSMKEDLLHNI